MRASSGAAAQRLLQVCSFGATPVPYAAALELQGQLGDRIRVGAIPDTLLLLQAGRLGSLRPPCEPSRFQRPR